MSLTLNQSKVIHSVPQEVIMMMIGETTLTLSLSRGMERLYITPSKIKKLSLKNRYMTLAVPQGYEDYIELYSPFITPSRWLEN